MQSRLGTLCAGLLAAAVTQGAVPRDADAIAAFARKEGRDCRTCHVAYPKLNETGHIYMINGYRFPGTEGTNVWEQKHVPLAMVGEVEAFLNYTKPTGGGETTREGPDGKIDEIELMGAGTLGKRVSFFSEVEFEGDPGFNNIDPGFGPIWVQINDLHGDQGQANLRLGQFDVDLPFFSQGRRIIRNNYLVAEKLGYLETQFGAQLHGQFLGDPDSGTPTHRYAVGVVRSEIDGDNNHFTKGYGWYAKTLKDRHHLGVMVMGGRDNDGVDDFDTVGVMLAGQTECDKWIFNGAYTFDYQNVRRAGVESQQFHNIMAEALYIPDERWVLGGRVDWLKETERNRSKDWGLRGSVLARHNIVSNVWLGAEYRIEDGGVGSPVTTADMTHKLRAFAFFAY